MKLKGNVQNYIMALFVVFVWSVTFISTKVLLRWLLPTLEHYADPMPQALVLTAIVIGFATTALFLVLLLAARGLSDTDHVDGQESEQ